MLKLLMSFYACLHSSLSPNVGLNFADTGIKEKGAIQLLQNIQPSIRHLVLDRNFGEGGKAADELIVTVPPPLYLILAKKKKTVVHTLLTKPFILSCKRSPHSPINSLFSWELCWQARRICSTSRSKAHQACASAAPSTNSSVLRLFPDHNSWQSLLRTPLYASDK